MLGRLIIAIAALAAISPVAAATTINFDDAPAGLLSPATYASTGAILSGFQVVDDTFGGSVVVPSGNNYAHVPTGATISFTSGGRVGTVNSVSFSWAGLAFGYGTFNGSTIEARDRLGNLLDSVIVSPEGPLVSYSSFLVTLTGSHIASLTFTSIENPYLGGIVPIDDLTFGDITAVPEPATWALMIAGFGMTGFAMRRRTGVLTA